MCEEHLRWRQGEGAEDDGKAETSRTYGTGIEDR